MRFSTLCYSIAMYYWKINKIIVNDLKNISWNLFTVKLSSESVDYRPFQARNKVFYFNYENKLESVRSSQRWCWSLFNEDSVNLVIGHTMFNVICFKQKYSIWVQLREPRCWSSISKRPTCVSLFKVRKNYAQVCSMSKSVNLLNGHTKFKVCLFEARSTVFEFNYEKSNTFEPVRIIL